MTRFFKPLTPEENACYASLAQKNLEFLMNRYNRVNRWVIADMIRRSCYHYPDKKALISRTELSLTPNWRTRATGWPMP